MRKPKRYFFFELAGALVALLVPASSALAQNCAAGEVTYMAVEPMREPLRLRGESRQQYLDRLYGAGKWQEDNQEIVRQVPANEDETARFTITAPTGLALERADIHVEAQIDYIDASNGRRQLYGHRELARYPLEAEVTAELAVPRRAFRESGAVLVAVRVRRTEVASVHGVVMRAVPIALSACPRHVYTHDRFSAIRLNRERGK